jgi:rod shape-determining protein MreD
MAGASLSDRVWLGIPAVLAVALLALGMMPLRVGAVALTPPVVWLMALSVGALVPAAWSVVTAFCLGLLADFLMGTPTGAQALISLLLTLLAQARRAGHPFFMLRWLEAACALVLAHGLLWLAVAFAGDAPPPFSGLMIAAAVATFWYPLFFGMALLLARLLPGGR